MVFKLFGAFLALIFFSVLPVGWYSISEQEKLVQSYVQKTNDAFAKFIGFHVFTTISRTKNTLELYARLPSIQSMNPTSALPVLNELVSQNSLFAGAGLYDFHKELIVASKGFEPVHNKEDLFSQTLLHQYGISLTKTENLNATRAEFRSMVLSEGQIQGALIMQLDMATFHRSLDEIKNFFEGTNDYASIYILDENNLIIAASKDSPLLAGQTFPPSLLLGQNLYLKDLQDYYQSQDIPPWRILFVPRGSAVENIRDFKQTFRYFLIFYFVLAAIFGWQIAKRITRPINSLLLGAEKISRGNLEVRIIPESKDEIGDLAARFDVMRTNLRDYQNHLKKKILELQTLYQVGTVVSKELDFKTLLRTILDTVVDVMAADKGSILLYDPKSRQLRIAMAKGLKREVIQKTSIAVGESVAGHVFETQQPMLVMDTMKSEEFHQIKKQNISPGTMLSVPLISNERPLGVLNLSKSMPYSFNENDLHLFQGIANLCATAIDNARLYKLAITDELTGLYIRRFFYQYSDDLLKEKDKPFALIMLDIDHFKQVNDTYGHASGDLVLVQVASLIQTSLRDMDIPCRLGGEEFSILCPGQSAREAEIPANRLRTLIQNTKIQLQSGNFISVTISTGIAEYPKSGTKIESIYDAADKALYHSKQNGRNKVTLAEDLQPE